ncbi:MAG: hypothetical protein H6669_10905 [Ardenticatenaceae bacterium]|nr:hypothetical protein [Ardenticatenaceae bacterium]
MKAETTPSPTRKATQTFSLFVIIFLVCAVAVRNGNRPEKLRSENRQTQLIGVLRLLVDPDSTNPDLIDPLFEPQPKHSA